MDNNLPTDDQNNQQPDNSNITPPETSVVSPPVEPTEKPIEIGSLEQPSFSTYTQNTNNSSPTPVQKSKKGKVITSFIAILLIIIALPLSLILVKQRQEIRKEAETPGLSGSVSLCGIKVSPIGQNAPGGGNYTFTYSITSTDGEPHTAEVHTYGCACNEGNRSSCGTVSGKCEGKSFTINTPHTGTVTAPKIGDCGTYQADVFILSVDKKTECYTNR